MSSSKKRQRVDTDDENNTEDSFQQDLNKMFNKKIKVDTESLEDRLYNLILMIEKSTSTYLNHENIIEDFKNSIVQNQEGMMNCCLECGEDIGRCNPRQLCGKTYCYNND